MKKKLLFLTALLTLGTYTLIAQEPPHPPSDPSLGGGNGPIGGGPAGAPVDGGLGILLFLGAGYAVKRVYDAHKVSSE
jgi:hypothetical protein